MRKLQIRRDIWLRGEGSDASRLHRSDDGKMCCVGIYLQELGVPLENLTGCSSATSIHYTRGGGLQSVPEEAQWLIKEDEVGAIMTSQRALGLYKSNDAMLGIREDCDEDFPLFHSEEVREKAVKDLFAENGVEVEFI